MIEQIKPLIEKRDIKAALKYLNSGGWLTEYKETEKFENKICSILDVQYCSAVPNGTTGLILALIACGIERGDKVAVPALTMIATANAVRFIGAEPVFVDINMDGCMDVDYLYDLDLDGVIYVSLNGRARDVEDILEYCRLNHIPLIEDACQAFYSSYEGQYLGTFGDCGVFSFSPHKIITTGQGGAIVTNSKILHNYIELLKDFGRETPGTDSYTCFGVNAKFTDLQAVIGLEQLKSIRWRAKKKRHIYNEYKKYLDIFMLDMPDVPWFVDIYVEKSYFLHRKLKENGIETRLMYPSIPTDTFYNSTSGYSTANRFSSRGLWLPSSLDITDKDIKKISEIILEDI